MAAPPNVRTKIERTWNGKGNSPHLFDMREIGDIENKKTLALMLLDVEVEATIKTGVVLPGTMIVYVVNGAVDFAGPKSWSALRTISRIPPQ
jgi:hypothetical protein